MFVKSFTKLVYNTLYLVSYSAVSHNKSLVREDSKICVLLVYYNITDKYGAKCVLVGDFGPCGFKP